MSIINAKDIKIYNGGIWRSLVNQKVYENGSWRTIQRTSTLSNNSAIYYNGDWYRLYNAPVNLTIVLRKSINTIILAIWNYDDSVNTDIIVDIKVRFFTSGNYIDTTIALLVNDDFGQQSKDVSLVIDSISNDPTYTYISGAPSTVDGRPLNIQLIIS